MLGQREKFLRILRLEMEDLEDHIVQMVADYRAREERHEVTEHVCFGNVAVLSNEDCAVRHFRRILESIRPEDYGSLDEMIDDVRGRFDREVCLAGLSRAACLFAQRKIQRVRAYVTHAWDPLDKEVERHATAATG